MTSKFEFSVYHYNLHDKEICIINHPRPKGRGIQLEVGVDLIAASFGEWKEAFEEARKVKK